MPDLGIDTRFGTWRGLVRLGLSYGQTLLPWDALSRYEPDTIRRLVFVCHGNICRSAFADVLARSRGANSVSFGLSTSTGKPAHPPIAAFAEQMALDASAHRTSTPRDIEPEQGDLLLAMEYRHCVALQHDRRWERTPRALLGTFGAPSIPHLHDPYSLSDQYLATCMTRIAAKTEAVISQHPGVLTGV